MKVRITLLSLALGMCFVGGCTPSTDTSPSPTITEYTVEFIGGKETETVKVEAGKTVSPPTYTPTKEGYRFNGWDFDFSTAIESDTEISAKWIYYSNCSTDFDDLSGFVGTFFVVDSLGQTAVVEENGESVLSATCSPTKEQTLTVDFDVDFPIGTKIVFTAKYAHNEEGFSGGAGINVNGEFFKVMASNGYAEYEVQITEELDVNQIAFRPNTEDVGYTFSVSEMHVIANVENVDFQSFPAYEKVFTYAVNHKKAVIIDEAEQKNVLCVEMRAYNSTEHFSLPYTGGVVLPAGSKIYVRMWYQSLTGIGGGCLNLNGHYQCGWGKSQTWQTYELTVDRETVLSNISIRPYNPSAKYIFKISSIRIEYATV